ncbi:MAG TPA: hypothetical protein VHN14_30750, partial [Kofleriaceae bacterium]|nr:hypothetical protein [Kofleriaceae bacterium]
AKADTTTAKFVTKNNGNERRNANAPTAQTINGGNVICAKYNYQPNGTNDTVRYVQCFNAAGATVLPQTKAFAKNNDDCSMHQDGEPGVVTTFDKTTGVTKMIDWAGCNGNGSDDGWAFVTQIKCNADPQAAGDCTFQNVFDVSLAQREERSRGACTVAATDTSYAVCSWTEGNNQPQRDGVWLAAVDLSSNAKGSNQQQTVLWKKQIAGRIDNANGPRTYAQRAVQERIMTVNAATNQLEPSDTIIYRWGDASGNNNTNQGKGGTYRTQMLAVIKTARTGMTYVAPAVDLTQKLIGLGGTHLGATAAMFGTTDHLVPGLVFLNGSHTGGGPGAMIETLGFDASTKTFSELGKAQVASQDRHLYSNYLGNNPGNQGRNHSQMTMVKNPFVGQAGNTDAYVLVTATSGKEMANVCPGCTDTVSNAAIKLTAFLTVTGLAQTPTASTSTDPGTIPGTPGQSGGDTGSTTPGSTDGGSDPGTTLGGCNAGGTSGGLATFFLIGLAAFIRRRR